MARARVTICQTRTAVSSTSRSPSSSKKSASATTPWRPSTCSSRPALRSTVRACVRGFRGSSWSAVWPRARAEVVLAGRVPGSDVVLGDGSLTFCTDGTGTYLYDDETGVAQRGQCGRTPPGDAAVRRAPGSGLRVAVHLGPRPAPAHRGPGDRSHLVRLVQPAHPGRGAGPGSRGAAPRDVPGGGRRLPVGPAGVQHRRLHRRPAAARAGDDRGGHGTGQGGGAGAGAAHAPHRHHVARHGARHLHHRPGRAAERRRALPAGAAGMLRSSPAWAPPSPTCAPAATCAARPRSDSST